MTRLSIPSEDVLGENYTITNITASEYNPTIDSTVTVTITVKDVYDDPVENKYVTTTCNIGKFTKLNNQTISDTQSVTAQTDSNGEISLTYTCSEWGLVTFSANNKNTQIIVKGYKTLYNNNNLVLQVNKLTGMSKLSLTRNLTINANSRITLKEAYTQGSDNEVICPNTTLKVPTSQDTVWIQIDYLGKVVAINTSNSNISNLNVQCNTSWSFKNNNY